MKKKIVLRTVTVLGCVLGAALLTVIGYVLYFILSYSRIPDNITLDINGDAVESTVKTDVEYTVVTQNLGFGAYTPDFTFFMDGGKSGKAKSEESVLEATRLGLDTVASLGADFVFFQELDVHSHRNRFVDQKTMTEQSFMGFSSVFAYNYDSPYVAIPIGDPHGAAVSGMMTLSSVDITSSVRRSLPVASGFSKYVDLDRCFTVSRVPVEGGKELVLINIHTSAYGTTGDLSTAQLTMLFDCMKEEYEKGNYVIAGGDFNHDLTGDSVMKLNGADMEYSWARPFPDSLIPEGFEKCVDYKDGTLLPTARNCSGPYGPDCMVFILDGFFVSENVRCISVENVDTGFAYSDHAPVKLVFSLE